MLVLNGLLAQKWYVKRASGKVNTYTLQAACSGKQLAADSNGNAVQRTADGSSEQLWRADFSGGFVVFTNVGTGRALDLADGCTDAGTNVQTYAANGTDAQRFSLRETQPLPEGLYTICLAGTDQVIDLRDESQKSNANNMWDYGDVLHLPLSMRQRGDVISWEGHVAIYLGNDMIIDAYGPVDVHSMWSRGVPRGVLRFYQ